MVLMSNPEQRAAAAASSAGAAGSSSLAEWAQRYSVETTPLGRGSFASVYKGVNRETKEPVAIKVMTKARLGERALQMLAGEISILRTLEHPNVVCLRDSHTTERRILIVLEFCGGGDLGQYIQARGPSPEATARHFMLQLAAGMAFLCSRRLIHRDIKPQNLLLSERSSRASLKIADFGLARHLPQGSLAESMLGSPLYMAPEVLGNRAYDAKADLWSAGAVLYELVTAKHPFGGANQAELINNIRRNRPTLPPGVTLSASCVELLGMLLVPQPSERASLQTFLSCSFLNPAKTTTPRGGSSGSGGGGVKNNLTASPHAQQLLPPLPSPRLPPAEPVHPTPPFAVPSAAGSAAEQRTLGSGAYPVGDAPQRSRLGSNCGAREPETEQGAGVRERAVEGRSPCVARGGGGETPGAQRRVGSALTPLSPGRVVGELNAAAANAGCVGSAAAPVSAGGGGGGAGGGGSGAGVAAAGGVGPRCGGGGSREGMDTTASRDAVGGRDGQWGWDWGGRGAPAGAAAAAAVGGSVAGTISGQVGGMVIGISDEGPLPALPALPFALEPLGMPRSFVETGDGVNGGGGSLAAPPVFAFDLAFARSPVRDRSCSASGDARERRSFSTSDAVTAREEPPGSDVSRRKRVDGAVVEEGTSSAVAGRSPPSPPSVGVVAAAASATTAAAAVAAATAAASAAAAAAVVAPTTGRRRSHSFSGQGLAPGQTRATEAAGARSESPSARKTLSAAGGRSGAPEPVVYLGRGGSVSGLSVSPAYGQSSPVRRIPPERAGDGGTTGILTPPSPAYYVSGGEAAASGGSGSGSGSGSGAAGGSEGQVAGSPQRGYPSLGSVCHQSSSSPTSPGGSGGHQQQHYHQQQHQYQHQPTPTLQPSGGGGGGGPSADAGGLPMLLKPSFRGSDSLLTIPEDSTGFVLVTRPPSISCEHGPGCECWAWSAGGGVGAGGLGGVVRSPSASYLASANPYGGPGKAAAAASAAAAAAAAAASGAGRRSGGVAFLGLGNIWNTAVNTFRGVAGAHGRRTSWPTRRGGAGQQQQRGSLASVPPPTASAVPTGAGAGAGSGTGASGGSSREYLSPRSTQQAQYRNAGGGASGGAGGASGGGSRSGSSSSGSSSGSGGGGGRGGNRNDPSMVQQGVLGPVPLDNSTRSDGVYLHHHHHHPHGGVMLASPADEGASRTAQRAQPRGPNNNPPQSQQGHHHRRHSEPIAPRPYSAGPERGGGGSAGAASVAWSPAEAAEARRVGVAADRAEVAGKRSILVVTLADKTAQEAMALALESPRDARGAGAGASAGAGAGAGARAGAGGAPPPAAVDHAGGASVLHAKRRHGMLTEALSLYVRALSILQGALPAVLVECDGVSADRFAAWNPLGAHHQQQQQQLQRQQQEQEQQQQRFGRSSPPSPALLSQRSALVTKASWLKDLFSQTLERAEHCRTQASVASAASSAGTSSSAASSADGASGSAGNSSSAAFTKDVRAFVPGAPWATLSGGGGGDGGGSSGGGGGAAPPSSDAAASAVYRSAMEHGQEAAVCYLLGRSDAAVTHYVRACALLQLLALEPEMAGAPSVEGGLRGGWQAQLLSTADMYARRVELISRGDVTAERQGFVYEDGRNG